MTAFAVEIRCYFSLFAVVMQNGVILSVLGGGDIEIFFKQAVEMAGGFEIEFVRNLHQGHIRKRKQIFCVLQLGAVDILCNRTMHVFFKDTRQLRITVRQILLRRLDLFAGDQRIVQLLDQRL